MEWFLFRNKEQKGPFTQDDFFNMGSKGDINPGDYVWNKSMKDWTPAEKIPGLVSREPEQVENTEQGEGDISEKDTILEELLSFSDAGPFKIERGTDTDLAVSNEVTNSRWYSGKKKVTYTARLLLREEEKRAYYWEMLKESSAGFSFGVGFEKKKIKGVELFQQSRQRGYSPTGELVYDYQFDYGSLREAFKRIIVSRGWQFKTVLMKGKASY